MFCVFIKNVQDKFSPGMLKKRKGSGTGSRRPFYQTQDQDPFKMFWIRNTDIEKKPLKNTRY
jgi:hypothetical protein